MDPSKAIGSPDIWQTFGLLAAFVATVGVFIYYLIRRDKALELIEQRSSQAHLEAAKLCVEAQKEGHAVMRECMAALSRASLAIERYEGRH